MYISILMSLDAYFPAVLNSKNTLLACEPERSFPQAFAIKSKPFWCVSWQPPFLELPIGKVSQPGV